MQKNRVTFILVLLSSEELKGKDNFAKSKGVKNNRLLTVIETKKHIYT